MEYPHTAKLKTPSNYIRDGTLNEPNDSGFYLNEGT